jgi:Fe-S-cluster containining protein
MSNERIIDTFYNHISFKEGLSINIPFKCDKCGSCCTLNMFVTASDLTGNPTAEAKNAIDDKVSGCAKANPNISWGDVPCPFYNRNSCSIHKFRPIGCKHFPSLEYGLPSDKFYFPAFPRNYDIGYKRCRAFSRYLHLVSFVIGLNRDYLTETCYTFDDSGTPIEPKLVALPSWRFKKFMVLLKNAGMTTDEEKLFKMLNENNQGKSSK